MTFSAGLIENSGAFKIIKREIDADRLSHAYLISGVDIGEAKAFARAAVRYIMCRSMCGECQNCRRIDSGNYSNLIVIDNNEKILTDDISGVISASNLKPFEEGGQYFIISDAGVITPQAQNKLLKTLEEPAKGAYFFLCTVKPGALLNTVKSRTAKIFLPPQPVSVIIKELSVDYGVTSDVETAAEYSAGSITKAREIISDKELLGGIRYITALPEKLRTSRDVINYSDGLQKYKAYIPQLIGAMEIMFSGMLNAFAENNNNEYGFGGQALAHIIDAVIRAKKQLASNCNMAGVTEFLFFTILEVKKNANGG